MLKPTTKMKKEYPGDREVIFRIDDQKFHLTFATLMTEMEQLELCPGNKDAKVFEGIKFPHFKLEGTLSKFEISGEPEFKISGEPDKQIVFNTYQLSLIKRSLSAFKDAGPQHDRSQSREVKNLIKLFEKE